MDLYKLHRYVWIEDNLGICCCFLAIFENIDIIFFFKFHNCKLKGLGSMKLHILCIKSGYHEVATIRQTSQVSKVSGLF